MARTADGDRGLVEIGLVSRGDDGLVRVAPMWLRHSGFTSAKAVFDELVATR